MDWSPQQTAGLQAVKEWIANPSAPQVFRLFGYAGTGKSTLAKYVGELETRRGGYVQYAAFTGKAAVVMRRKGCLNARTIHSIIYTSRDKSTASLTKLTDAFEHATPVEKAKLKKDIEAEKAQLSQPGFSLKDDALTVWEEDDYGDRRPAHTISLFVIDECSMVDERLGADLLSFNARVLVLGDPAQLPPVYGAGYFTNAKPDVLLTEIHRQALDSPIIDMANQIRQGNILNLGQYGDGCGVVTPDQLKSEDWLAADQILVGKNRTRTRFNGRLRTLKGFEGFLPQPGEKLVCLRNNPERGLLNGSLWECVESEDKRPKGLTFDLQIKSLDEDDRTRFVEAHKSYFVGTELNPYDRRDADEFDFGYALTVHKSQGSQWNNVILYDEWTMKDKAKWQYTGITRAAERITVVRP